MHWLFFNELGRVRSGWRATIFFLSFLLVSFVFIFSSVMVLSQSDLGGSASSFLPLALPFALSTAIALLLGWICGKLFENVPFRSLGAWFTRGWLPHLGAGVLLGGVALCIAVAVAYFSGSLTFSVNRDSSSTLIASSLLSTLLIFLVGAASEETLFRGYMLQTLSRAKLAWLGGLVSSLLFSLAHNNNHDASLLSGFNTFLAGVWFVAAYLRTRDLWFPFGMHVTWNWLQGPVFGINVSGISELSPDPVMRAHDLGPVWLTGGAYGIEGGVACTIALAIAVALTLYLPGLKPNQELFEMTSQEKPVLR